MMMDLTAVYVHAQRVREAKKAEEKKENEEREDRRRKKNEETERIPLVSAKSSVPPPTDGRRFLFPIEEVDDERDPESPPGSSQSLGYVAVPIVQPYEAEAGAAAAPGAAAAVATTNNDRNNGGKLIVGVNTRTRDNLVTSRRLLMECLAREEASDERKQDQVKKGEQPPKWIRRVVGFCRLLIQLCVLIPSALVKLILLRRNDTPRSG